MRVEIDLRDQSVRCVNNRAGLAVCLSMINIPRVCNQEKGCKSKVGELGVIPVCACINVCMCIYAMYAYIYGDGIVHVLSFCGGQRTTSAIGPHLLPC